MPASAPPTTTTLLLRAIATRPLQAASRSRAIATGSAARLGEAGRADSETHREEHIRVILREQKEGRGAWKEEFASDSEMAVKADRGEAEAGAERATEGQREGGDKKAAGKVAGGKMHRG